MTALGAIVIGGTGAVGSVLVAELLASSHWQKVVAIGRRALDVPEGAAKLASHVVDLAQLERDVPPLAEGVEAAFCTLGVGQPRKVSREELWKIDVDYAAAFARGCRAAGVRHFSLLTAAGADANARADYFKMKGTIEDQIRALGFARASFFRPSLLVTKDVRYGLQDRLTQAAFPLVSWLLPARFHQITVEELGRAMRLNAERPAPGNDGAEVLHYPEFRRLLDS